MSSRVLTNEFLRVEQVASLYSLSNRQVRHLAETGVLRRVENIGRLMVFFRPHLVEDMRAHRGALRTPSRRSPVTV